MIPLSSVDNPPFIEFSTAGYQWNFRVNVSVLAMIIYLNHHAFHPVDQMASTRTCRNIFFIKSESS